MSSIPTPTKVPRSLVIVDEDMDMEPWGEGIVTTSGMFLLVHYRSKADFSQLSSLADIVDHPGSSLKNLFFDKMTEEQARDYGDYKPKPFFLYRETDKVGVSGEGVIVEGFVASTGAVSCCWLGPRASMFQHTCLENLLEIQCNPKTGVTRLEYYK